VPRAPANADAFNAIAEPRRRRILAALASRGEQPVTALVHTLDLAQPAVSKHLAILRQAGLVSVSRRGRERFYSLQTQELRKVHAWIATFERFWDHKIDRIAAAAEAAARSTPEPGTEHA
jgi:DNA-binding transcriptional ArsR family regulator